MANKRQYPGMCGRYAQHVQKMQGWTDIIGDWPNDVSASYNVAPTATVPVYTPEGWSTMRWSLIPSWSNMVSSKYATFNARIESIAGKPAFRNAWKRSQRCLIPALGYYEWRTEADGKQPCFVADASGAAIMFGGLYEPAREDIPASCTIITRPASGTLEALHSRMPVLLSGKTADPWLHEAPDVAQGISMADPTVCTSFHAVAKTVNNVRNNSEELIAAV